MGDIFSSFLGCSSASSCSNYPYNTNNCSDTPYYTSPRKDTHLNYVNNSFNTRMHNIVLYQEI